MIERLTSKAVEEAKPLYTKINNLTTKDPDNAVFNANLMLTIAQACWMEDKPAMTVTQKLELANILISDINEYLQDIKSNKTLKAIKEHFGDRR